MSHKEMDLRQAMLFAARQTFENMAFVEVREQAAELSAQSPQDPVWACILINDPLQGEIRLTLPRELLIELAANMFGLETEEVTKGHQQDIIAEILNTLAGLFMTNLLPDDQAYKLGLPEHGTGESPPTEEDSVVWNLQVEQHPLILVAVGFSLLHKTQH